MFKFKGISSTDMQVIIEEEEHFIARAAKRYETIEIEGRDGSIFNELGYSYVERPIYVQCLNIDKIDDILAWLDGEGEFEYKGRKTIARFYSELEPKREGYIRIIDTTFIRDPFWIKANEEFVTVKESKVIETEEAKSLHVEDANKFGQLEVLGNHEQETREGYNLLQNKLTDTTINGVTFKINEDKSVTVNGTATANIIANLITGEYNDNNASEPLTISDTTTNCRLSGCPSGGSNSTYKLDLWTSNGVLKGTDYGEGINISMSSDNDRKLSRARLIIYSGATVNNLTFKPMLVAGTEEKEYEQYGASPSPDYPSPVKCLGSNKNIYDDSTSATNQRLSTGSGGTYAQTGYSVSGYIEILPNQYLIINTNYDSYYCFYNAERQYVSGDSFKSNKRIKSSKNVKYIKFDFKTEDKEKIKVEYGSQPTSYSPYGQGSTLISKINKNFLNLNNLEVANNNGIDTYSIDNPNQITLKNKATTSGIPYNYAFQAFHLNLPQGDYNLSAKTKTNSTNYRIIIRGKRDGSNTTAVEVLSQNKNNGNFNIDYSQCDEYAIEFYANQSYVEQLVTTTYYDIQIQKGNIATDYIEHQQTDYLLYIQQEMLKGDYFIKEADGWKEVHGWNKYIFTGNENLYQATDGEFYRYSILMNNAYLESKRNIVYSNYYISKDINIAKENLTYIYDGYIYLYSNISSLEEFKQFLQQKYDSSNPVYAFYKTTTQTKLPCTEEQISVLEELNNLDLFERVNNIITAEDIALLKLKYMKITDEKINNEGNVESRPILRLEKTSTESVELTINNCRFNYNFNGEEYVEIDCEEKEVKYEGLNRNRQIEIGYDFPILNIGDNDIKMHSGDCVIKVLRKDRWL